MSPRLLVFVFALAATACGQEDGADPTNRAGVEAATDAGETEQTAAPSDGTGNGGSDGGNGNDDRDGTPDEPDDGQMEIVGVLTDEGVECPALRGRDGQLYTLAGNTGEFETGDAVTVTGTRAEVSFCQQGTTIDVESIERAP